MGHWNGTVIDKGCISQTLADGKAVDHFVCGIVDKIPPVARKIYATMTITLLSLQSIDGASQKVRGPAVDNQGGERIVDMWATQFGKQHKDVIAWKPRPAKKAMPDARQTIVV